MADQEQKEKKKAFTPKRNRTPRGPSWDDQYGQKHLPIAQLSDAIQSLAKANFVSDQIQNNHLKTIENRLRQSTPESPGKTASLRKGVGAAAAFSGASNRNMSEKIKMFMEKTSNGALLPHKTLGQVVPLNHRAGFTSIGGDRIYVLQSMRPGSKIIVVETDTSGNARFRTSAAPQKDLSEATSSCALLVSTMTCWDNPKNTVSSGTRTSRVLHDAVWHSELTSELAADQIFPDLFLDHESRTGVKQSCVVPVLALAAARDVPVTTAASSQITSGAILYKEVLNKAYEAVDMDGAAQALLIGSLEVPLTYTGKYLIQVQAHGESGSLVQNCEVYAVTLDAAAHTKTYTKIAVFGLANHNGADDTTSGAMTFLFDENAPVGYLGAAFTNMTTIVGFDVRSVGGASIDDLKIMVNLVDYEPDLDGLVHCVEIDGHDSGASFEAFSTKHVSFINLRDQEFNSPAPAPFMSLEEQAAMQSELLFHGFAPTRTAPTTGSASPFAAFLKAAGRKVAGAGLRMLADKVSG